MPPSVDEKTVVVSEQSQGQRDERDGVSGIEPRSRLNGLYWMVGPKGGLEGDDDRFDRLLDTIDTTLRDNPYLSGVYVLQHWNLVEPEEGKYQFDRLDKVIGVIRQHGRHYKLSFTPGIYSPEWLYEKGAEAFHTTGSNPLRKNIYNQPVKIPVPWDPIFHEYYFRALARVAQRYRNDANLYAVTLTLANFMSSEWHLPHQKDDREKWGQLEGYPEKIETAWKYAIDQFAKLFPDKQLVLEASSWPIGMKDIGSAVIDYGATEYSYRFTIQINQMVGRFDMRNSESYQKLLDFKDKYGVMINIGIQNLRGWEYPAGREAQGSMKMSVYNYLQSGADYWELWWGDGQNIATCEKLTSMISEAKALRLAGYRDKLKKEGEYYPPK